MNQHRQSPSPPPDHAAIAPLHSVAVCPICDAGLCGIRICTGDDPTEPMPRRGFVICDECEAVWMVPDVRTVHQYLDSRNPICPICHAGLWTASRWADRDDLERLGWSHAVDAALDGGSES
ncbi:hypothetical protein [Stieleria mannarensis]|uniref:hypothetical protein n=1 Tax=Stieleria mannarensis TaxID=2755585 RepID=UPI0016041E57|nr:hypothetical protein [Rhodopirellula sp. JC639]